MERPDAKFRIVFSVESSEYHGFQTQANLYSFMNSLQGDAGGTWTRLLTSRARPPSAPKEKKEKPHQCGIGDFEHVGMRGRGHVAQRRQKLRIVTVRFGTGRQKMVLERWTKIKVGFRVFIGTRLQQRFYRSNMSVFDRHAQTDASYVNM